MNRVSSDGSMAALLERLKTAFSNLLAWLKRPTRLRKWAIYFFGSVALLVLVSFSLDAIIPEVKNPSYGTSFSVKYAKELGVDWQENFTALLDDMRLRNFRLMSYWDTIEVEKGRFNFDDLDWQMDEAQKRGAQVSLAIGLRQPRWPECHAPKWYDSLSKDSKERALLNFIDKVVSRYKNHPALASYQLENEALNRHFGSCSAEDMDQDRLAREYSFLKTLDTRPVYMSLSDQHGLPIGQPVPDKYGFSVYRTVWNDKVGPFKAYVTYPTPVWYHRLRAQWIKSFQDRDIFIHELQLEPWGPRATKDLSVDEQNKSMSTEQIHKNLSFARKIGSKDIYTWGSEWWYWRMTQGDASIWQAVKSELSP